MHPSEKSTNNPKQGFVMVSGQSLILNGSCAKFFGVNHAILLLSPCSNKQINLCYKRIL